MEVPVTAWSCSQHDYPEHCEECDNWRCEECKTSRWKVVGWREASPYEEMIYSSKISPMPVYKNYLLDAMSRQGDDPLGGGKVTIPLIVP